MKTLGMTTLTLMLTAALPAAAHEELPPSHRPDSAHDGQTHCMTPVAQQPRELRDVGWAHARRAPIYFNVMMLGEGFVEDDGNRLTTRDTQTLEGFGGLMRLGGVVNLHSRVGIRMQSFMRPTKKVISDDPVAPLTEDPWGAVMFGYIGPEYLYTADSGVYFAGSVGFAGVASRDDLDDCHDGACDGDDDLENGSLGAALMGSAGYEWRANKWFAVNAEAFAGLYRGVDDDESSMTNAIFGLGVGVGF